MRWSVRHGMPPAPRSGGHNYAGYSTTTGLLIDLRRIRAVSPQGDRLAVGGGATNSDVYRAGTGGTGLYFPGGRCPGVGVAGLALGGGLGFNDRRWGLTCDRLRRILAPLLALSPARRFVEQRGFWQAQDRLALKSGREAMAAKSLVPTRWPDEEAITAVTEGIGRWRPGLPGNSGHVTFFAMGGAVSALAPSETAFPHRRAVFGIDIGASWSVKSSVAVVDGLIRQTQALYDVLARKLRTSAAYVNFPDPDLTDWRTAYYGANYRRLAEVKSRYDPSDVFRYGQSIGSPLVTGDLAS